MKIKNYNSEFKTRKVFSILTSTLSLAFVLFTFFPPVANAQAINLKASPSILKIQANSENPISSLLTIENLSDESVSLRPIFKTFKAANTEDGQVEFVPATEDSLRILEKIEILQGETAITELPLGPKQSKKIELRVTLNGTEIPKDYYFSIILISQNSLPQASQGQNSSSLIQAGVGTNVLLSVRPSQAPLASIEEFSSPASIENGPVPFTVRVKNNGLHVLNPKGVIYIKNIFGQTIGKIELPETNILSRSTRSIANISQVSGMNDGKEVTNSETVRPKAVWDEKFLFGPYTAELQLSVSENGPLLSKTIKFTAFPTKMVLGGFTALIIGLLIYFRVKQKMS